MTGTAVTVLAVAAVAARVAYLVAFFVRSPSMLAWVRGALVLDAGIVAVWAVAHQGLPPGWLPFTLWLITTVFDVGYYGIGRYALRQEAHARQEWQQAQLVAGLPPADRAWVQQHLDLATIRLADRVEARR
ncbi:hypothetical protein ABZY58_12120 [Micromonospora tulbaghiae]|uniref:hypothetical protein n=1 Tax=Micromonospora tulbaghiae TaxID=479978 RepID=UPI0033B32385